MLIPFATQSYRAQSLPLSAQRLINAFAEQEPETAKSRVAVLGAPGLTAVATCGAGPIRGMHVLGGVLYVVSGTTLYSVTTSYVVSPVGAAVSGNGVVAMADNGTQLAIVNGTTGYIYTTTGGFVPITDANFFPANTVTHFDGYFVFDKAGTNVFFNSNLNDGTTYNGLAFATAEVSSENIAGLVNQQENLIIFSGAHSETWYDAGQINGSPFLRIPGGTIERGMAAPLASVKEDNSVFFLGSDLVFYRLNGTQPVRVSTHAIEATWALYVKASDAFCFSYTFAGHKFVVVTFPAANATWELDISTGLWHERDSWDINNNNLGRWRANCATMFNGVTLIGDAFSGQIGQVDQTNFTEFGNTMRALMTSPPIHSDRKRLFIPRLEIDLEAGVGLNSGQGSNPQAMLSWSKDGGKTFVAPQLWSSMGALGANTTRMRWLRLGQAREWVFSLSITDPVRRTLMAANADVNPGM